MSSVYQLHYADGTPLADVTIQWTSSTSTWADLSQTQNPVYFTKNSASASTTTSVSGVNAGNTIRGWKSNGGLRSRFVHPTGGTSVLDNVGTQITELEWALWGITSGSYWECISIPSSSGGDGTSTEGVATPFGTVGRIGQSIVVTIDNNSPSSSSSVSYVIQKNGVSQGPGISHTNNTSTDFVQNLPFSTGIWRLWYQESGGSDQLLDTFNASEHRKRHFNFW